MQTYPAPVGGILRHPHADCFWNRLLRSRSRVKTDSSRSIWEAAKAGDVEAIPQHIKDGVDPSEPDTTGMPPLGRVAAMGGVSAADVMLNHGADIDAQTVLGDGPLDAAGSDEFSTVMLAELIGVRLGESQIFDRRGEVFEFLTENNAEFGSGDLDDTLA